MRDLTIKNLVEHNINSFHTSLIVIIYKNYYTNLSVYIEEKDFFITIIF